MQGVIFNIQRYSIHDGPGIRTTVFLKGCPLKCFWCQNPESQQIEPEILFYRDQCTSCGHCIAVCQSGASVLFNGMIRIDRSICTGCGICVKECPNEARKLVGRYITVEEILDEVFRDVRFYENSGGGVTLSGGEPTYQADFALAILQGCKERGLHTALDTCGHASWTVMEKLLEYTDLVLYDIKHMDPRKHNKGTGRSNRLILENARKIARCKPMRVRVPVIPDFNDSFQDIRMLASFVRAELGMIPVDLLTYNKMGEAKYERLDKLCPSLQGKNDAYVQDLEAVISLEHSKETHTNNNVGVNY